jgi:prepilin-type N-terminal cleavage/methylation domain-containing protein
MERKNNTGFTLIELSIVLVIIGLILGGVLVGQDLIKAASIRAQISQIEKYHTAVRTFRLKSGQLPGDLDATTAGQLGFAVGTGCDGSTGNRDGNGILEGHAAGSVAQVAETEFFWQDLSAAELIEGGYGLTSTALNSCHLPQIPNRIPNTGGRGYLGYFNPPGKLGYATFLYVYSMNQINWFGLSAVTNIGAGLDNGILLSSPGIPVSVASNIDTKVDDGLPTSGGTQALYINSSVVTNSPAPNAATDDNTTCYNTTGLQYSTSSLANQGTGANCALSFKFQ